MITKQRLYAPVLIALLALAMLAVACGGDDDDSDPTATPEGDAATATASAGETEDASPTEADEEEPTEAEPTEDEGDTTAAYPVTIEHKYGSTEITERPERIVVVGLTEQDALLALGVVPVATSEWYGGQPGAIFPWATELLGDAPVPAVLEGELDIERVAAQEPDLILGLYAGLTQDQYDQLSQVAPTVAQPEAYVDWGIPWQEATIMVGRILGEEERAEELVAEVEQAFVDAREAGGFTGGTGAVLSTFGEGAFSVYTPEDPRGRFMASLGFDLPPALVEEAADAFYVEISDERVGVIESDAVIWFVGGEEEIAEMEAAPLYSGLTVHQEGRDFFMLPTHPAYDALNFSTVLSLPYALEHMTPILTALVDGDPATEAP